MIIAEGSEIKVGGIILPGIFQKSEIEADAKIDEVDVKGKSVKPKQATGYEDAKITLEILLIADDMEDEYTKLEKIQSIFKQKNQQLPQVHEIFNKHLNTRGITRVLFKQLHSKETNKENAILVKCEFWEYIPMTIQAKKKTSQSSNSTAASGVSDNYNKYLQNRGSIKLDKTKASPARDNDFVAKYYKRGNSIV